MSDWGREYRELQTRVPGFSDREENARLWACLNAIEDDHWDNARIVELRHEYGVERRGAT